jgi:hypothetical protein
MKNHSIRSRGFGADRPDRPWITEAFSDKAGEDHFVILQQQYQGGEYVVTKPKESIQFKICLLRTLIT